VRRGGAFPASTARAAVTGGGAATQPKNAAQRGNGHQALRTEEPNVNDRMFDAAARRLAAAMAARRGVLRWGAGAALVALGLGLGPGRAAAACRAPRKGCGKGRQCCSRTCRKGRCAPCGNGRTFCGDACADLATSNAHCGACGIACAAGQRCVGGGCVCDGASCDGCCDGAICRIDDPIACGNGGGTCVACGLGQDCLGGACVCTPASCPNGCCAGTTCEASSDRFCGINGNACRLCGGGEVCEDGVCVP
jgi:hypothetical protein